jgi:hypothetical protein
MNIRYSVNQGARVSTCGSRRGARGCWQRLQHLLHNLRLQWRDLRLKGLRNGLFDELPHLILPLTLSLLLIRHA